MIGDLWCIRLRHDVTRRNTLRHTYCEPALIISVCVLLASVTLMKVPTPHQVLLNGWDCRSMNEAMKNYNLLKACVYVSPYVNLPTS